MTKAMSTAARRSGALACAAVAVAVLLTLAGCGDRKSAADYIKAAQTHLASNDIRAAVVDLKNALQKEPKNVEARTMLGQTYVDLSDATAGEVELQHARDDGATPAIVNKPLAQAEFMLRKPKVVLELTEPIEGASPQLSASLLALRGEALFALGQRDEAAKVFAEGLKADPDSVDVQIGMGRAALTLRDLPQAKEHLAIAQKEAPKSAQVIELAGDVAFADADFAGSEQAYQSLHKLQPWSLVAELGIARAQISQSKLKEAIANLDAVLKSASKDPSANYLRALAAYLSKDMPGVQTFTQRALSRAPNYAAALLLSGASSYALMQYEEANKSLGHYLQLMPGNLQARKLLASTQMRLNRPGEAVKTLTPAISAGSGDAELLAMIGTASARSGDAANASQYLEKAVEEHPESAALRTELGMTKIALGETSTGIDELEKAVQQDPKALRPEMALYLTYMHDKLYDKALVVAQQLQKSLPDNPVGWNFAAIAYLAKGDKDSGRAALLKAREIRPGDLNADRNLAKLAIADGKLEDARSYYREAIKANPKNVQTYVDLAELELKAGRIDQAKEVLAQAAKELPDDPAPQAMQARILLQDGKPQNALNIADTALSKNPHNAALLEVSGLAEAALGRNETALGTFKTLADVLPKSAQVHLYLSSTYIALRRGNEALTEANIALKLDPTDYAARFAVAKALMANANFGDASKAIGSLRKDYPKNAAVLELEGTNAMADNRPADAIPAFQEASQLENNSFNHVMLATAQSRVGELDAAKQTLKTWLETHSNDLAARMALGDIYLSAAEFANAKEQYETMVRLSPNSAIAENNLAWSLAKLGRPNEALAHARRAAALQPNVPAILDTLGVILTQSGIPAEAVDNLRKARQGSPNDPTIQLHLAQALAAAGQKSEALDMLHGLLASDQKFKDRTEAEKLLQDLTGG